MHPSSSRSLPSGVLPSNGVAVAGEPDRGGPSGLAAAFLVALALHGAGLIALTLFKPAPAAPPGENIVTIDLAPQMAEAESQSPAEQAQSIAAPPEAHPVETPETVAETKPLETTEVMPPEAAAPPPPDTAPVAPEATTMAEPPEVAPTPPVVAATEPPPEDQVITSTAETALPLAPPPPVVAQAQRPVEVEKPKPDQSKILEARREAKRKADREARLKELQEERREAAEDARREAKAKAAKEAARRAAATAAEGRARQNSASSSRQSSSGAAAGGNDPSAMRSWLGQISSTIHGRMNRNAAAGTAGGVAVVHFVVSRSGQILSANLSSSSGVGSIDSAAMAAVRGSLPAAPPGVTVNSQPVNVPLRFSPGR